MRRMRSAVALATSLAVDRVGCFIGEHAGGSIGGTGFSGGDYRLGSGRGSVERDGERHGQLQ